MKNLLKILLIVPILLTACTNEKEEKAAEVDAGKAEEMATRIKHMEDSLFQHMAFDQRSAHMLMDVYKAYVGAFPLDHRSPEFLFRAAGVSRNLKDPEQSIRLYDRIVTDYPNWEKIPETLYMKAFVYDNDLQRKGEAKVAYEKVYNTFPDHDLADQARIAIDNLQYTDEELIERFRRMQDSTANGAGAGI
jgi:TolA-binding protein